MDSKVTRPESIRKRPLELSNSSNGDSLPTKFKTGPTPGSVMDCTAQFAMEQKVHDVEEHFRRSLQSFQPSNGGSGSFLPVSSSSSTSPTLRGLKKKTEDGTEPHQIVIAENNTSRSSVTTSSPQNLQFIMTSSPTSGTVDTVPTVISALPGAFPPSFFLNISSTTDKPEGGAQLLTAAPALATTARKGGTSSGGSLMLPTFQGMIPTIAPNLIPVIDNSGTPQLIPATTATANTTTPTGGTSPVFYMSPNGIPMLTQGGVVFMNPTDMTRSQQHISVATPQHNASSIVPNYIILPPTFTAATNTGVNTATGATNFSLTLEQLVALNNLQQQQQIQQQQQTEVTTSNQRVNIDLTASSDDHSSVVSGGSMDDDPLPSSSSNNNNNIDSVEEHFARALGDQWHQLKQSNGTSLAHSDHNKITA